MDQCSLVRRKESLNQAFCSKHFKYEDFYNCLGVTFDRILTYIKYLKKIPYNPGPIRFLKLAKWKSNAHNFQITAKALICSTAMPSWRSSYHIILKDNMHRHKIMEIVSETIRPTTLPWFLVPSNTSTRNVKNSAFKERNKINVNPPLLMNEDLEISSSKQPLRLK